MLPLGIHLGAFFVTPTMYDFLAGATTRWVMGDDELASVVRETNSVLGMKMFLNDWQVGLS